MTQLLSMLLVFLCGLSAVCAQDDPRGGDGDPRDAADPRVSPDPRDTTDPRDEELLIDPRDVPDPREEAIREKERELADALSGADLFDSLYDAGSQFQLVGALRQEAWSVLPYLDELCNQWLQMIEAGLDSPQSLEDMDALETKAREIAELTDKTLGDSRFEVFVDNYFGWSPEEQAEFRESQDSYQRALAILKKARNPREAQEALAYLERSEASARALGDTWGVAMSMSTIAQVEAANRFFPEARESGRASVRIGRQVRDLDSVWSGLGVVYSTSLALNDRPAAESALTSQHQVAQELGDQPVASSLIEQLILLRAIKGIDQSPTTGAPSSPRVPNGRGVFRVNFDLKPGF